MKKFKSMMNDPQFYDKKLKKTILNANGELFMTRLGSHCTDAFVKVCIPETCDDSLRD
jgi:hypothetical protein